MTQSDFLWARVSAWLAERTVKECFIETFELVDQLCDALEIDESCIADLEKLGVWSVLDKGRIDRNLALIRRARQITGKEVWDSL